MRGVVGVLLANQTPLPGLAPDYGVIPPAFLPFGERSLLIMQIEALTRQTGGLVVALPEGITPPVRDRRALQNPMVTCREVITGAPPAEVLASLRPILSSASEIIVMMGDAIPEITANGRPAMLRLLNTAAFVNGDAPELERVSGEQQFQRADVKLYHRAKVSRASRRCFNTLTVEGDWVRKRATDPRRILFEAAWFQQATSVLEGYIPPIDLAGDGHSYRIGLQELPLLSELFLRGQLNTQWPKIAQACVGFLSHCLSMRPPKSIDTEGLARVFHRRLIEDKTASRLAQSCAQLGLDPDLPWRLNGRVLPSLREVAARLVAMIPPGRSDDIGLLHGDFHFGNIFANVSGLGIRVIDPRGTLDDRVPCPFGDIRYDMAKLLHSVEGRYDMLMNGEYRLCRLGMTAVELEIGTPGEADLAALQRTLNGQRIGRHRFDDDDVRAITALLFLTMPPMHADRPDRQLAMIANGLRLAAPLLRQPRDF